MASRRDFLKSLAALALLQCASSSSASLAEGDVSAGESTNHNDQSTRDLPFKVSNWTGDDFTLGHKLRMSQLPAFPVAPERHLDFVIVGGGIAGLTAGHQLRDRDILVLEQYAQTGGHASGGTYKGLDYSLGSAYTSSLNEANCTLFDELKIKPLKLEADKNAWYWQQHWCRGVSPKDAPDLCSQFEKLLDQARPIIKALQEDRAQEFSPSMAQLDQSNFASLLKDFTPEFNSLMDSYCRTAFCGGTEQISALAGYLRLGDLLNPTYVFRGGNFAVAKALRASIENAGTDRIVQNAFVWKVEIQADGASILYSTADGASHRIQCRHVIIATSPLVAARQLSKVEDRLRAQLLMFKFGSYLVANCLMRKQVFPGSYNNFVAAPYSFADIVVAETPYLMAGEYKPASGSVLTVYQPYPAGSEGRGLLFAGDRMKFAEQMSGELKKFVPQLEDQLEEMVLTRWGHALAIVSPGYFGRVQKIQAVQERFGLAHSSISGGPTIESAIRGGLSAAKNALKTPTKVSVVAPCQFATQHGA